MQSFAFPFIRECSSLVSKNGAVSIYFHQQPEKCLLEKLKSDWVFGCVAGVYFLK